MGELTVLSLCDVSTVMVQPWHRAGYRCVCVDIQHPEGWTQVDERLWLVGADLNWWLPERTNYKIVFAFPPCTHLAVSGARWFHSKGIRGFADAISLVDRCRNICEWSGAPWLLENPVGTLSSYWRKPDYIFDPCDFGGYLTPPADAYTKKTCIWSGGGLEVARTTPGLSL